MIGLGLATPNSSNFFKVFQDLLFRFSPYHWLIDSQSGPFRITDKTDHEILEAELEKYLVDVPRLVNSSTLLWKPGILPRFAELLVLDESTYLIGLPAEEQQAIQSAIQLAETKRLSPMFFDLIERKSVVFLMHVNTWWEIYSADSSWTNPLREIAGAITVDSLKWQDLAMT